MRRPISKARRPGSRLSRVLRFGPCGALSLRASARDCDNEAAAAGEAGERGCSAGFLSGFFPWFFWVASVLPLPLAPVLPVPLAWVLPVPLASVLPLASMRGVSASVSVFRCPLLLRDSLAGFGPLTHSGMSYTTGDRKSTRLNSSHITISYAV